MKTKRRIKTPPKRPLAFSGEFATLTHINMSLARKIIVGVIIVAVLVVAWFVMFGSPKEEVTFQNPNVTGVTATE